MGYAILRVAKIKSATSAKAKTAHNYREHELSNVNPQAPHPNREYVNDKQADYWSLATARIDQVATRKVRADQVRAMEVVMTGSPESFKRDAQGEAVDYSRSKWAQDNLYFLQNKYGKENVVSFTLHQDEKTPHIHAVIVPLTADGRLSAKDLFNPRTLRELQTEYAQAMQPHGMERGVEHSQTKHQAQRRLYGQADQVAQLVPAPAAVQAVQLDAVPLLGREEWRAEQEAKINAELTRQVQEAQERANAAIRQVQANAMAQGEVKTLRKQLATSEGLKQAHFDDAAQTKQHLDRLAVGAAQGDMDTVRLLTDHANRTRADVKTALTGHIEQILKGKVSNNEAFLAQLSAQGYRAQRAEQGTALIHEATSARFFAKDIKPNGQAIPPQLAATIKRTQEQSQKRSNGPKL
jgi:hypothetical protein